MKIAERRKYFKAFLKKKKYSPSTPDWLLKLVMEAFDYGIAVGEKSADK